MKLTKKIQTAILDVYEAFWGGLFNADIEVYTQVLDDNYRLIGTTEKEVFFSKKEATRFLIATADQMAGNLKRKNSKIKIEAVDNLVFITEQFDAYVLIENDWQFYGKTRVSTWMQQKEEGWKLVQQHFSFPDAKADDGQTIGLEKITRENIELREAIKRRTIELENKNRELEIETALEKVRTVAMSMKQPADMLDICKTIALQLQLLGTNKIRNVQTAIFYEDKGMYMNYEYYAKHDKAIVTETSYTNHKIHLDFASQMLKGKDEFFHTHIEGKKKLKDWIAYQQTTNVFVDSFLETSKSLDYYWYSLGPVALGISTYEPLTDEETNLFKRFLQVFELAYRRYLDIEKAEMQTREAQIEAALEKIRNRSLSMHQSNELKEVIAVMFEKLKELNVTLGTVAIWLFDKVTMNSIFWVANNLQQPDMINLPYDEQLMKEDTNYRDSWQAWLTGKEYINKEYNFEQKNKYFEYVFAHNDLLAIPAPARDYILKGEKFIASLIVEKNSALFFDCWSGQIYDDASVRIFRRASKVFEQAYVRFLDLQKAEEQAREAKIESSLERVRSKTMAMHDSKDLLSVISTLSEQFQLLGFKIDSANFNTSYRQKDWNLWLYNPGVPMYPDQLHIPYFDHPYFNRTLDALARGADFNSFTFSKQEKDSFLDHLYTYTLASLATSERKKYTYEAPGFAWSAVYLKNSAITIANYDCKPYTIEENAILRRFGNVFEQTYTRFLDLQKAEEQAREAQIEAALEKVRAVAMSMMKSEDLSGICKAVFTQLQVLGFGDLRASQIYIRNDDEEKFINYDYSDETGAIKEEIAYNSHPNTRSIYDVIRNAGDGLVHNVIGKEEMQKWKSYLYDTLGQEREKTLERVEELHYYLYSFGIGAFGICNFKAITDEELQILKRFRNVFSLSYQRYTDISLAEAQAREAHIELSLERVRAKTLAMQKSDELPETAAVLFQQLIALGIEPNRLYITIVKNETGDAEFWLTDEDGSKVSTAYSANLNNNPTFSKMYEGWKSQQKSLVIDISGEELQNYFQYMSSLGVAFKDSRSQKRRVQDIAYFSNGFIGMASPDEQPPQTLQLLERFAYVFNLTFTRFNDLQIAEAHALQADQDLIKIKEARQKAEEALIELQATQKQLIQSEKMASLGELTAGIAHEIQNPLNFVNNFSEVNKELAAELKAELTVGNLQLAAEIANDIQENSDKINNHGKRAEAIVKGMLQHSRSSAGQKELTDINALADEYLRLSYHGLRAKDAQQSATKSFNATIKTDFDATIGKIEILPQDIGRVLLNLYNNAFYAIHEKAKTLAAAGSTAYEPTISVSTKKSADKVLISVADNGSGIPQKILDKIFQPFFTTKPTGQGTGLGLSLAYDIVTKGHSGTLKVITGETNGSEFIVELPIA